MPETLIVFELISGRGVRVIDSARCARRLHTASADRLAGIHTINQVLPL